MLSIRASSALIDASPERRISTNSDESELESLDDASRRHTKDDLDLSDWYRRRKCVKAPRNINRYPPLSFAYAPDVLSRVRIDVNRSCLL